MDDEIPLHGYSHASSSHEESLEPLFKRREDLGKHSVYTHFLKDRNCEICKKDQNYKGPCNTIPEEIITVLTRYRPIVLELI